MSVSDGDPAAVQGFVTKYGLQCVLDDPSMDFYDTYGTGSIPQFAVVDAASGTNRPQWQVLWTGTGYTSGDYVSFRSTIDGVTTVPEPSTFVLLGMGAVTLVAYGWRRRLGGTQAARQPSPLCSSCPAALVLFGPCTSR